MPIPLGSWLKLAIAPLAASNAASCVRGVGPSVKKSPPAQTRPSFVRASALTEVNPEETPLIGGADAVGGPPAGVIAGGVGGGGPPAAAGAATAPAGVREGPPANHVRAVDGDGPHARRLPRGQLLAATAECGGKAWSPVRRERRRIDSHDRRLRHPVDERPSSDVDGRARRSQRL